MQLDACVRSILERAPYSGSITVVYRASDERFQQGYAGLELGGRVRLVEQGPDFRAAVLDTLQETLGMVVFHTDDDLFFRTPPCAPLLPVGCAAFSLRLGENTTHCYPFARDQRLPDREAVGEFIVWRWDRAELDFAYPMSLDGHIFEADTVRSLLADARFRDPNELERELHLRRHRLPRLMVAFRSSCVVAVPVNVVTSSVTNRSGADPMFAPEALNERFLRGDRIDLNMLDVSDVHSAHAEIPLVFTSAESRR